MMTQVESYACSWDDEDLDACQDQNIMAWKTSCDAMLLDFESLAKLAVTGIDGLCQQLLIKANTLSLSWCDLLEA